MLIELRRAGDRAEGGQKDEARDWLRAFENSRVFELLCREDIGVMNGFERQRVKKQLAELRIACHPLDVHEYKSDLAALRGELAKITKALGIAETAQESLAVGGDNIIQFTAIQAAGANL